MNGKSWPVESLIPCGIKKQGVKCDSLFFTAIPSGGNRPPVFRCDKCGFIKYRLVIVPKKEVD